MRTRMSLPHFHPGGAARMIFESPIRGEQTSTSGARDDKSRSIMDLGRRRSPRLSTLPYHAVAPGPELPAREVDGVASLAATPLPSTKHQAANPPSTGSLQNEWPGCFRVKAVCRLFADFSCHTSVCPTGRLTGRPQATSLLRPGTHRHQQE